MHMHVTQYLTQYMVHHFAKNFEVLGVTSQDILMLHMNSNANIQGMCMATVCMVVAQICTSYV